MTIKLGQVPGRLCIFLQQQEIATHVHQLTFFLVGPKKLN
jgi:hypothetical protein